MQSSIGGPEGKGGVFSQNIGCFAPCYWDYIPPDPQTVDPSVVNSTLSTLTYYDDNRLPIVRQVRLGVNYRRSVDTASFPSSGKWRHSDITDHPERQNNRDGKLYIFSQRHGAMQGGNRHAPASQLHPMQIAAGIKTVFKPNWRSGWHSPFYRSGQTEDPAVASGDLKQRNGTSWEDENWEIRADPVNKVCTIVNITLDDAVVCSSEWENCGTPS